MILSIAFCGKNNAWHQFLLPLVPWVALQIQQLCCGGGGGDGVGGAVRRGESNNSRAFHLHTLPVFPMISILSGYLSILYLLSLLTLTSCRDNIYFPCWQLSEGFIYLPDPGSQFSLKL